MAALDDQSLRTSIVDLENEAGRLGIAGVPFFIINDTWAMSGAQPPEAWRDVLRRLSRSGGPSFRRLKTYRLLLQI